MKRLPLVIVFLAYLASLVGFSSPAGASVPNLEFTETGCEGYSDSVARLYAAGLGREPEKGGFEYWMGLYTSGDISLLGMSDFFVSSPEFDLKYGDLSQLEFVNQIYLNVLGRFGEPEGVEYWDGLMTTGTTRGELLVLFAESPENVANTGTAMPTLGVFNKGLDQAWSCDGWPKSDPAGPITPINPGDAKNCGDFSSHAAAQAWFDTYFPSYGDIAGLDSDGDGIACEDLR